MLLSLAAAWPLVAWAAARALVVKAATERADALVVLSGSYVERTGRAAELFREGRAPLVILTNDGVRGGWLAAEQRNPLMYELATAELVRGGVPRERIVVLPQVVNSTYEEARAVRDYAAGEGIASVLLVTSAYHSRRALWTMRHAAEGVTTIGVETTKGGDDTPSALLWWLRPSGWRNVAAEYPKFAYYWLNYR